MQIESDHVVVRVRDGRFGRDPAILDPTTGFGELLATLEVAPPGMDIGQLVTLSDGTTWPIIGVAEHVSTAGWEQHVTIGEN